jgi:Zn-dependent peptidase ImmA (M78 family)
MRRGFKTWAEKQAVEQRHNLGLRADASLPAMHLAAHLGITVLGAENLEGMPPEQLACLLKHGESNWSATTLTINNHTIIIHNTSHAPTRQESNLMHEIAHVICEHKPSELMTIPGLPFFFRDYNADLEEEAGWLGACLQVPRTALLSAIRRHMSIDAMVQYFQASEELIRYRRQMTGVDRQLSRALAW